MNAPSKEVAVRTASKSKRLSLVESFASKLGVEPEKMLATLRATAFNMGKNQPPVTNEEMMALLVVAHEYRLNPFLKEIYAFRGQNGAIVPIIGVDGWIRLLQEKQTFNGMEFAYDEDGEWVECTIHRTDRTKAFTVREYLAECQRDTGPWKSHPRRMLRHRALIQCARVAYGFGGMYDPDEGEAIAIAAGVDLLPVARAPSAKAHTKAPEAKENATPLLASPDQVEAIKERLAVTGLPDNVLLAKFEIGDFPELRAEQVVDAMRFISDNSP
jgi:phage recombination protein Bet